MKARVISYTEQWKKQDFFMMKDLIKTEDSVRTFKVKDRHPDFIWIMRNSL